ncbi:glutathione S-transferase family protein [Robiginitomaculum antarcticum]|uniref:glutathione S-transferase family protein n=1 Tax=Robiginitomaculum antarcticum TaxID=437507 RepID=UPI00036136F6|nr:glutathione S-transferase N-terminal domain-containing protein [Robiginitomaculum antarcticum]
MKFYDCSTAPSPRRARIFIAEKGLDIETVDIDLRKGEQLGDAFCKINPRAAVPALITDDGEAICENVAIAQYLEAIHPKPNLMGHTALEMARVSEWNWRLEFEGLSAVAEILRNSSPYMKGRAMTGPRNIEQLPELAERGRIRIGYFWEDLNAQLSTSAFVASDRFTFADITALVLVDFSKWVESSPPEDMSAIWAWYKTVSARPACQL